MTNRDLFGVDLSFEGDAPAMARAVYLHRLALPKVARRSSADLTGRRLDARIGGAPNLHGANSPPCESLPHTFTALLEIQG
jgi:hypothetical protein